MDANSSRYHLICGEQDWLQVEDTTPEGVASRWDGVLGTMALRPELPIFPRGRDTMALVGATRRGPACDRFGTWYWIAQDRQTLYRAPASTGRAQAFWRQPGVPDQSGPGATVGTQPRGAFFPDAPPLVSSDLAGAAVTTHHYLIVGILDPPGLLIFDLHAGGQPLRLAFPATTPFEPFDLAPAPDGGVWVLDRANRRLWGLDRFFRLLPLTEPTPGDPMPGSFSPEVDAEPGTGVPRAATPAGLPLSALPTALEVLPNGGVLVLAEPAHHGESSRLLYYAPGSPADTLVPPAAAVPLPNLASVTVDADTRPVVGHDMALAPGENQVLIVEQEGNQAFAFDLDLSRPDLGLAPSPIYLPLHRFGGRALAGGITRDGRRAVFYDVTPQPQRDLLVRWMRLHEIPQPRFTKLAWLESPILDSRQRSITWHRLFLDACIPADTAVEVQTRSGDDRDLLRQQAFMPEPEPYLRSQGAEIPYWDHWRETRTEMAYPEHTGTWEVLFQHAQGRFLQVRLVLTGNGRATPQLYGMRTYFPRYSYVKNYLPAAYQEDASSADFLERLLANMEGFYTDLEGRIATSNALFDPRSAPPDTLNWLAAWLGLVLDPLWSKVSNGHWDRRRLMIRFALRLYERRGTVDGLRFALLLFLDPCLESTLERLERATVSSDPTLSAGLERLGLPVPALNMREDEIEDLLYQYVLLEPGRSRVRIVERWQARHGLAVASGDPTRTSGPSSTTPASGFQPEQGSSSDYQRLLFHPDCHALQAQTVAGATQVSMQDLAATAHRFSVLIPEDLPAEEAAMVEKIVRLEKPAHTNYDIRRFWDYFLVGQVRLGIDTVLGEDSRFLPIILGGGARHAVLSEGYLEAAHPMNVAERTVSDRDRLGAMKL